MSSKGKPILYTQVKKVLYVLLHSVILFYRKLMKELDSYGFNINPYDSCVANNMINDKQMTLVWHVNFIKVSHIDSFEINKF